MQSMHIGKVLYHLSQGKSQPQQKVRASQLLQARCQIPLKEQIDFFKLGLHALADRKRYKITREDEKYMVMCFMILIKLKHYDFDDVCLDMPRRKKPKKI